MLREDEMLKYILETTQVGYFDFNFRDGTKYTSARVKEILGYQEHELPNQSVTWTQFVHPDDIPLVKEAFHHHVAFKGETPLQVVVRCYHKRGTIVWVQCQGKVTEWSPEGEPLRFTGSCVDVTAQKQANAELKHYQSALTSLKKIAITNYIDYDKQIDAALRVVSEYLALPLGIVSCIQDQVYEVVNVYAKDILVPVSKGQVYALNHTYCGIFYRNDTAVGIHHVGQSEWAIHPYYMSTGLETYIGAPVRVRGKRYGTVCFLGSSPRTDPFSRYELEFIEIIANWIGYSVEKREVNKALKASQKKARAVFENSRDAIMLVDHATLRIVDCNQMAVDLYELDGKKGLIGRRGIDFHEQLFTEEQHQGYQALMHAGDFFSTDVEYVTKKGKKFWGNLSVFVFALEDHLFQWVRIVDVSEARNRERELREVKEILSQQAKELQEANEQTRSINDSLEYMVRERTIALEERNRRLADFAFLNAHKMRGPLARILGLVDVLKLTDSREQEKEYLQHIVQSAEELDQAIKTAANTLVTPEYAEGDGHSKGAA